MAILLTNGKYYIAHNSTGAVIKVSDIEQAQDFYSVERAIYQRNRTPGKCAGYYYIDTEKYKAKIKRKNYSDEERKIIYNKSGGRCELCGQRLLFEEMTLDHIVPLSMAVRILWKICKRLVMLVINSRVIFSPMILWTELLRYSYIKRKISVVRI